MSSTRSPPASEAQQSADQARSVSLADLEDGVAALLSPISQRPIEKSVAEVVAEMVKETKFGEAEDIISVLQFAMTPDIDPATKLKDEPAWYNPRAMHYAAYPCRLARGEFTKQLIGEHKDWISGDWKNGYFKVLDYAWGSGIASQALVPHVSHIVGIDEDQSMVDMYNEIAKRPGSSTCVMQAYLGDLMPQHETGKVPGIHNLPESEKLAEFDLAIISLGMDCFEILDLSPTKRHRQLVENLQAITSLLRDDSTLLIIDIEKATHQTGPSIFGLIDGYTSTGYHSSDIVKALRSMGMDDIEVRGDNRFLWEATAEESEMWLPAEADEVFFMLKARKRGVRAHS